MPRRKQLLIILAMYLLLSTSLISQGIKQRIEEFPVTEQGTEVAITFNYPDSPFQVNQYFEISFIFQVKSLGDLVEEIFVKQLYVRLSVNFRDYTNLGGSFKIDAIEEKKQKTFGFYINADEIGIFPGQFADGRLEYQIKWEERIRPNINIEYEMDWRLVDNIHIQNPLIPEGKSGPAFTPVRPIIGFEIIAVLSALFTLFWIRQKGKNAQ